MLRLCSLLLILSAVASSALAQTCAITSPTAAQSVAGYDSFSGSINLAISYSGVPALTGGHVQYTVDAYPAVNPGFGGVTTTGNSTLAPYTYPFNSYWYPNGPHQVYATLYDALNNVLCTTVTVNFTTANTWPQSWNPTLAINPATPFTSNWSGYGSGTLVTGTITGSGGGSQNVQCYIDGIQQGSSGVNVVAGVYSYNFDTTGWLDGPHVLSCPSTSSSGWLSTDNPAYRNTSATEWSRKVTFAQPSPIPVDLWCDSGHENFKTLAQTQQITCHVVNSDQSTATGYAFDYYVQTPANCSVSSTGLVTLTANLACIVRVMAEVVTGTDLFLPSCCAGQTASSASNPFTPHSAYQVLRVKSGTGFTPGYFEGGGATGFQQSGNIWLAANGSPALGTAGSTNGTFAIGPSATVYVYAWPTNVFAYIGTDGAVHTSYSAANAIAIHEIFSSGTICQNDAPYGNGGTCGDVNRSAHNTVETGMGAGTTGNETSGGAAAWQSAQAAYTTAATSFLSAYPNLHWWLTGDNFTRNGTNLYGSTNGPAAFWATPAFQYAMSQWAGKALGITMRDEGAYGSYPLQGPMQFGTSSAQNGLTSIVATGGGGAGESCLVTFSGSWSTNNARKFIISGSATTNMNSASGATYSNSVGTSNTFTFTCANVADGTYNISNDPGLTIEPYGDGWYGSPLGHTLYTAFATLRTQANAVAGAPLQDWGQGAVANGVPTAIANWNGNGTQSLGAITQVSDYADILNSPGTSNFILSRNSSYAIINPLNALSPGNSVRINHGVYSLDKPLMVQTQANTIGAGNYGYGQTGFTCAVTSMSGNTITFSAPCNMGNIQPGMTRLSLAGATGVANFSLGLNVKYYVLSQPTPTTATVAYAATTFTCTSGACVTGNGGTITFSPSNFTKTMSNTSAKATVNCLQLYTGQLGCLGGDLTQYAGAVDPNFMRHRGETFTFAGVTGSGAND